MTPNPEPSTQKEKPRLALAIATALGVGYAPKAPGTFGSLVGVVTIFYPRCFFCARRIGLTFSRCTHWPTRP